jgi:hypothetical protein
MRTLVSFDLNSILRDKLKGLKEKIVPYVNKFTCATFHRKFHMKISFSQYFIVIAVLFQDFTNYKILFWVNKSLICTQIS